MNFTTVAALGTFPLASLFNSFSMTALMLVLGVAGCHDAVAEIGLVQGATLALFYAFSANARNLILSDTSDLMAAKLLKARIVLLIPLSYISYYLSVVFSSVSVSLAVVLIVRRMSEWIGEIGLAEHEKMNQTEFAQQVLFLEISTLILSLVLQLIGFDLALSAIPWALAPFLAIRGAKLSWNGGKGEISFSMLLPNFGSTVIIGASVYIFRLSIVLISGKTNAGELFAAFAIGGVIPTILGQALAPSLLHRFGPSVLNRWLVFISVSMLLIALVVIELSINPNQWLLSFGHSQAFFLAVGFSIMGGAIMSIVTVFRARLIQGSEGTKVFGPDLLSNVLIIASVPFLYQAFGAESLAGMYCLSGFINIFFLWGCLQRQRLQGLYLQFALLTIASFLIFPLFFMIDGSIFRDPSLVFDTLGAISRLPVPISLLSLFVGIALLNNYVAAKRTLYVVLLSVLLLVASLLVVERSNLKYDGAKLILLMQCVLPMFGLILGQMFGAETREPIFERTALVLLLLLLPAQLIATWQLGYTIMSPLVFLFSIYQHLQYFPMIVVALVTMASLALWKQGIVTRIALTLLIPIAFVQICGSMSISAIFSMTFALTCFALTQLINRESRGWALSLILATYCCGVAYISIIDSGVILGHGIQPQEKAVNMTWIDKLITKDINNSMLIPLSLVSRIDNYEYYFRGVVESPQAFLFGHSSPPDRSLYPSAHNYWLDIIYNFGFLALLPLFILLLVTLKSIWKRRAEILCNPLLIGTSMAAIYLILGENMLKSGMRQPYPGIITFFIWGLLITRLDATAIDEKKVDGGYA
jgi:hypothetical protein